MNRLWQLLAAQQIVDVQVGHFATITRAKQPSAYGTGGRYFLSWESKQNLKEKKGESTDPARARILVFDPNIHFSVLMRLLGVSRDMAFASEAVVYWFERLTKAALALSEGFLAVYC